jgi:hypothetical protein
MKRKIFEPVISKAEGQRLKAEVSQFENDTSYCPLYLAWRVVDEARDYFRTPIPEAFADKLARRAQAVFAHQPFWRRKLCFRRSQTAATSAAKREFILKFMRHWLAGILARERPALFRALPESFKVGLELPERAPHPGPLPRAERVNHRSRFVHGCELLAL